MTKHKKLTIYSVAEDLGLSPSTISKSLRSSHEISEEIRLKVVKYCEEIGFRRRRFTPSRINICAVVQRYEVKGRWLAGFVNEVIEGIVNYTNANGLEFSLYGGEQSELDTMDLARELRRRHVDAVVFLNVDSTCKYIVNCAEKRLPFYCIQGDDGRHADRIIRLDNPAYSAEAVRVLGQLGHRSIAMLSAGPALGASLERRNGYLQAMRKLTGTSAKKLVVEGHPEKYDPVMVGYYAAREIFEWRDRPTAIISEGLKPPIGFLRACHEMDVRVPEDISIISIGTSSELESLVPSVSAVESPARDLGEIAAQRLHRELLQEENPPLSTHIFPKPRVIMRESVAAPRK